MIRRILFCTFLLNSSLAVGSNWKLQTTSIAEITKDKSNTSSQNRPISVYRLSNVSPGTEIKNRFFIQAGLHANEKQTTVLALKIADNLSKNKGALARLPAGTLIDIVPKANPDSEKRYNHNNINLNRNFSVLWGNSKEPYGVKPFSEKETKSIKALFDSMNYTSAIDIHGFINWIVIPSSPKLISEQNPTKKQRYKKWVEAITSHTKKLKRYEIKSAGQLGDGGAFEDWSFWEENSFSVCLEMDNPFLGEKSTAKYEGFIFGAFTSAMEINKEVPLTTETMAKAN